MSVSWQIFSLVLITCTLTSNALIGTRAKGFVAEEVQYSTTQKLSNIFSKGIYIVLAFLITACVILTGIKKLYGDKELDCPGEFNLLKAFFSQLASKNYEPSFTQNTVLSSLFSLFPKSTNPIVASEEIVKINGPFIFDKGEHGKLRKLEQICPPYKESEKDNAQNPGGSEEPHDAALSSWLIQKADMEKEQLTKELATLQREAKIAAGALKDQHNLLKRLENARREVSQLRLQMVSLKKEKDMAVEIMSQVMASAGLSHAQVLSIEAFKDFGDDHKNSITSGNIIQFSKGDCNEIRPLEIVSSGSEEKMNDFRLLKHNRPAKIKPESKQDKTGRHSNASSDLEADLDLSGKFDSESDQEAVLVFKKSSTQDISTSSSSPQSEDFDDDDDEDEDDDDDDSNASDDSHEDSDGNESSQYEYESQTKLITESDLFRQFLKKQFEKDKENQA